MSLAKYLLQRPPPPRVELVGSYTQEGNCSSLAIPAGAEDGDTLFVMCTSRASSFGGPLGFADVGLDQQGRLYRKVMSGETNIGVGTSDTRTCVTVAAFRNCNYVSATMNPDDTEYPLISGLSSGDVVVAAAGLKNSSLQFTGPPIGYSEAGFIRHSSDQPQCGIWYKTVSAATEQPANNTTTSVNVLFSAKLNFIPPT